MIKINSKFNSKNFTIKKNSVFLIFLRKKVLISLFTQKFTQKYLIVKYLLLNLLLKNITFFLQKTIFIFLDLRKNLRKKIHSKTLLFTFLLFLLLL